MHLVSIAAAYNFDTLVGEGMLQEDNFFIEAVRLVGWGLFKFLYVIYEILESFISLIFDLFTFMDSPSATSVFAAYNDAFKVVLILSLVIFGTIVILSDNRPKILQNLLIGMAVWMLLPFIMSQLNKAVLIDKNNNLSSSINWTDYVYDVDQMCIDGKQNMLTPDSDINKFRINALNTNSSLAYHLNEMGVKEGGYYTYSLFGIKDVEVRYFKYHIDFFLLYIYTIAYIIIYAFVSFKLVKILWELLQSRFLAMIFSAEINSGQRLKKILEYMLSSYMTIYVILFSLKLFSTLITYINNYTSFAGIAKGILIIFLAIIVIDGPNVAERILGIDAGINNHTLSHLATSVIHKARDTSRNISHSVSNGMRNNISSHPDKDNKQPNISNSNSKTESNSTGTNNIQPNTSRHSSNTTGPTSNINTTSNQPNVSNNTNSINNSDISTSSNNNASQSSFNSSNNSSSDNYQPNVSSNVNEDSNGTTYTSTSNENPVQASGQGQSDDSGVNQPNLPSNITDSSSNMYKPEQPNIDSAKLNTESSTLQLQPQQANTTVSVSDSNVNDVTHNSKVNDNFKASKDFEDVVNHPTSFNGNNTSTNIESIPRSLNKTFNLKKPRRK